MTVGEITKGLNGYMKNKGYKKKGNSFYKIENEFVRVIYFYKSRYFNECYVNLGIEPYKFPKFRTGQKIYIEEYPDESSCVFRISLKNLETSLREFSLDDNASFTIKKSIEEEAEKWFDERDTFEKNIQKSMEDLNISSSPLFREKKKYFFLTYCFIKLCDSINAKNMIEKYFSIVTDGSDFYAIDNYLRKLYQDKFEQ